MRQSLDHLANDAISTMFTRLSSRRPTVAKLVLAIFASLLFGPPSNSTTIVMLLLEGGRVIVAADGIQTGSVGGRNVLHRQICKIREVNEVQISVTGMTEKSSINAFGDAKRVFSSEGTFQQCTDKLDRILMREIEETMASLRVNDPLEYNKYSQPGQHIIEVLIVGYEDSRVVIAILVYEERADGTVVKDVKVTRPDQQESLLTFFGHTALIATEVAKPEFKTRILADPVSTLKHLIEIEYDGDEVGPPIAITEFKDGKVNWIERGACKADK
jgi:hypothetical protein